MKVFLTTALLLTTISAPCAFAQSLTSIPDILGMLRDTSKVGTEIEFTGEVRAYSPRPEGNWSYTLQTEEGPVDVYETAQPVPPQKFQRVFGLLDRIHLRGHLIQWEDHLLIGLDQAERLSRGDPETIPEIDLHEFNASKRLDKPCRLRGLVRDATQDDSDPNFIHLTLRAEQTTAHLMVREPFHTPEDFLPLIGSEIVATGLCSDNLRGLRRHIGRILAVSGLENVRVASSPASFDEAPNLERLASALPHEIDSAGFHQVSGTVLATWGGRDILLRTNHDRLVRVTLQTNGTVNCGTHIRARGLPATDYYNLNLLHALVQVSPGTPRHAPDVQDVTPEDLLTTVGTRRQLRMRRYGSLVRMIGVVRQLPDIANRQPRMFIEAERQFVAVDATCLSNACQSIPLGSTISVTGICIMNADDWNLNSAETSRSEYFLVPRTVHDIAILERPSWWTPRRLFAILAISASLLVGILLWNVALNRRAKAKGRELAAEQLAHVSSELKVSERTRLAVELHDALSQTLTGVSMQIDTAAGIAEESQPAIAKCLKLASRTIDACRLELRNTLWDLRSAALDEPSMDAAISKTLCQNLTEVNLSVRFNVAREAFSDNTAHTVLKIIRELATNALRHGKATAIHIAGTIEGDSLRFSVRDNGCGFNPDLAPGIGEGHFGLQGIAERLERLDGEMTIDSRPGTGTKVTIIIPFPRSGE